MKKLSLFLALTLAAFLPQAHANSTIDATEKYAYGANIGWINFKPDQPLNPDGAVTAQCVASGQIYSANCGWINLGDGSPDDGIAYSNSSATDFGVNVTIDTSATPPVATLSGFAYGANIGWINFEAMGNPRINLTNGDFQGSAYSANCGWINLGDANAHPALTTNTLEVIDSDGDTIDDSWELQQAAAAGKSAVLTHLGDAPADNADNDGGTDREEYLADTNPFDASDRLHIIEHAVSDAVTNNIDLTWSSKTTRIYDIRSDDDLDAMTADFTDLFPDPGTETSVTFTDTLVDRKFWDVQARLPLSP